MPVVVVGRGSVPAALGSPQVSQVSPALDAPDLPDPGSWFGVDLGRAGGFCL